MNLGLALILAGALGVFACKPRSDNSQLRSEAADADDAALIKAALTADQQQAVALASATNLPSPLDKAALGTPLSPSEAQQLLTVTSDVFHDCRFSGVDTPLFLKVKTAVRSTAIEQFQQSLSGFEGATFAADNFMPASERWRELTAKIQQMDCLGLGLADIWPGAESPKKRFSFRSTAEVSHFENFSRGIAWPVDVGNDPDAKFLQPLTSAFEFIDFMDILVNMVPGAPRDYPVQDRPIWTLYDGDGIGNLQGWREAAIMARTKAKPELRDFYGVISRRFNAFTYRDQRVVGGGDIDITDRRVAKVAVDCPIRSSWIGNTKFFRATTRQMQVLMTNPLVTTQYCEEFENGLPTGSAIGQYEYPSAMTYAPPAGRQPARFAAFLSIDLKRRLDEAKVAGKLATAETPEFKELTRAIIIELVAHVMNGWDEAARAGNPASYPYQLLMSIHPSDDFNGRSLRGWFRHYESLRSASVASVGIPLFLLDFNLDLFTNPAEFYELVLVSNRKWARMMAAFNAERSGNRKYFDVTLPWAIAADCDDLSGSRPQSIREWVRNWMRDRSHINLIRMKQKYDIQKGLEPACSAS